MNPKSILDRRTGRHIGRVSLSNVGQVSVTVAESFQFETETLL